MNDALYLGLTTCDNPDVAERLAHDLVERKLAVCVQIESVQSIYIENGDLKNHPGLRLSIKFLESQMRQIDAYMLANHMDEFGEWVSFRLDRVSNKYLKWATDSLI
jgi:periplasmic divalent cation tolerance protein